MSSVHQYQTRTKRVESSSTAKPKSVILVDNYSLFSLGDAIQIENKAVGSIHSARITKKPRSFRLTFAPPLPDSWNGAGALPEGSMVYQGPGTGTGGGGAGGANVLNDLNDVSTVPQDKAIIYFNQASNQWEDALMEDQWVLDSIGGVEVAGATTGQVLTYNALAKAGAGAWEAADVPPPPPPAPDSITRAMLAPDSVGIAELANGAVGRDELANNAVTTPAIRNGAITAAKIAPGVIPVIPPVPTLGGLTNVVSELLKTPVPGNYLVYKATTGADPARWEPTPEPTIPVKIGDLSDVDPTGANPLADGMALIWKTNKWEGAALPSGVTTLAALNDTDIGTPAAGNVLEWDNVKKKWVAGPPPAAGAVAINDLSDVDTATAAPTGGQFLSWNQARSRWVPGTETESVALLTDTAIANPVNGQILIYSAANSKWVNQAIPAPPPPAAGSITTAMLAPQAVSNAKLAPDSVHTVQIQDGQVTAAKLAAGVIPTHALDDLTDVDTTGAAAGDVLTYNAVTRTWADAPVPLPGPGSIIHTMLDRNAVDGSNIAGNSITAGHIADGTITKVKLAAAAITDSFVKLSDTPAGITANTWARGNAAGNALEFVNPALTDLTGFNPFFATRYAKAKPGDFMVMSSVGMDITNFNFAGTPADNGLVPIFYSNTGWGVGKIVPDIAGGDLGKVLTVVAGNRTEWQAASSAFVGLSDTPGTITANQWVKGNAAGNALEFAQATFGDLSDTPASYTGAGGKWVRVHAGGTRLEFATLPTAVDSFAKLTDTPTTISAAQWVRGNAGGTALEFAPLPAPAAGSITHAMLAAGAVDGTNIAANAIKATHIAPRAVGSGAIALGVIPDHLTLLTDVDLTTTGLSDGQALIYDRAASTWQNKAIPTPTPGTLGGLSNVADEATKTPAPGNYLVYHAAAGGAPARWEPTAEPTIPQNIGDLGDVNPTAANALADGMALIWKTDHFEGQALPSGVTTLTALNDTDIGTPAKGNVLEWDDTKNKWVAGPSPAAGAIKINDLSDVDTATAAPTGGQFLAWDDAAKRWKPKAETESVSLLTDTTITTPTNGQILAYSTATNKWINQAIPAPPPPAAGSIVGTMLAAGAVTRAKIGPDAVHTSHIADGQITAAKLAPGIPAVPALSAVLTAGADGGGTAVTNLGDLFTTGKVDVAKHVLLHDQAGPLTYAGVNGGLLYGSGKGVYWRNSVGVNRLDVLPTPVAGDAGKLVQVNAAGNAIEFATQPAPPPTPDLDAVLTAGNDANGQDMVNVRNINLGDAAGTRGEWNSQDGHLYVKPHRTGGTVDSYNFRVYANDTTANYFTIHHNDGAHAWQLDVHGDTSATQLRILEEFWTTNTVKTVSFFNNPKQSHEIIFYDKKKTGTGSNRLVLGDLTDRDYMRIRNPDTPLVIGETAPSTRGTAHVTARNIVLTEPTTVDGPLNIIHMIANAEMSIGSAGTMAAFSDDNKFIPVRWKGKAINFGGHPIPAFGTHLTHADSFIVTAKSFFGDEMVVKPSIRLVQPNSGEWRLGNSSTTSASCSLSWYKKPMNIGASVTRWPSATLTADVAYITRPVFMDQTATIEKLYVRGPNDGKDATRFNVWAQNRQEYFTFVSENSPAERDRWIFTRHPPSKPAAGEHLAKQFCFIDNNRYGKSEIEKLHFNSRPVDSDPFVTRFYNRITSNSTAAFVLGTNPIRETIPFYSESAIMTLGQTAPSNSTGLPASHGDFIVTRPFHFDPGHTSAAGQLLTIKGHTSEDYYYLDWVGRNAAPAAGKKRMFTFFNGGSLQEVVFNPSPNDPTSYMFYGGKTGAATISGVSLHNADDGTYFRLQGTTNGLAIGNAAPRTPPTASMLTLTGRIRVDSSMIYTDDDTSIPGVAGLNTPSVARMEYGTVTIPANGLTVVAFAETRYATPPSVVASYDSDPGPGAKPIFVVKTNTQAAIHGEAGAKVGYQVMGSYRQTPAPPPPADPSTLPDGIDWPGSWADDTITGVQPESPAYPATPPAEQSPAQPHPTPDDGDRPIPIMEEESPDVIIVDPLPSGGTSNA